MMCGMSSTRPGPQPKGRRAQFTVRLPERHLARYRAEADERGMHLTDYLAMTLAEAHGLEAPPYLQASEQQPPLPAAG